MTFFPNDQTFLKIGSFHIQYYALCIIIGAVIAYFLGQYQFQKRGYSKEILSDYFYGVLFTGIIGARIWYVIFMWDIYASHPEEIIAIWHGGLAIQGGLIVGVIYSMYYFKKHDIPFLFAGDSIMPGVLVAQAIGRWGNFFNQEAYGSSVSKEFLESLHIPSFIIDKMYIQGSYHHPTFLYESLGNILVFLIIVLIIRRLMKHQGIAFFSYFVGYGIIRFFVESLRTDSLMFMGLRMAQITSIGFIILGVVGILYCHFKGEKV